MKNLKKGFTLIELLVVVAIVALLASVVMASLNSSRKKAQKAAFQSEINSVVSSLNLKCTGSNVTLTRDDINPSVKTFNPQEQDTYKFNIIGCVGANLFSLFVVSTNGAGQTAICNSDGCEFRVTEPEQAQ